MNLVLVEEPTEVSEENENDKGRKLTEQTTGVSLPKATVNKFANEVASSLDIRLTAETRELIASCCSEFVQLLSSEANEICENDKKKTITPEHVLRALTRLGLERYLDEVTAEYNKVRAEDKSRGRAAAKRDRKKKPDDDELMKKQQELFAAARQDPMNAINPNPPPPPPGAAGV